MLNQSKIKPKRVSNKQMKIIKKLYKKVLFVVVGFYIISIFISQQKTLNTYQKEIQQYEGQIEEAQEAQDSLVAMKDNVNSPQYIEELAREKLSMYLPNEKVYIDIGK